MRRGADLINDTWAGADPGLVRSPRNWAPASSARTPGRGPAYAAASRAYADVVADVVDEVVRAAEHATALGVKSDSILVDPTHDFGKNTFHGLELLRRVEDLVNTDGLS